MKRPRRKQTMTPGRRWFCPTWVSLDTRWSFYFYFFFYFIDTRHTSPRVSSSRPTDTDWAKETNGKRKEEEDPEWSTQRVKYWSDERGQTQVRSKSLRCFPWRIKTILPIGVIIHHVSTMKCFHFLFRADTGKKLRNCGNGCASWRQRNLNFSINTQSRSTR